MQKRRVCEVLRQVKPDAHVDDQNAFWAYVTTRMAPQTRTNLAKAMEKGGNSARSSMTQAFATWTSQVALAAGVPIASLGQPGGGRGQANRQGQQKGNYQHTRQEGDKTTATGKGRGATTSNRAPTSSAAAAATPTTATSRATTTTTTTAGKRATQHKTKGAGRSTTEQKTPWADLVISDQTPIANVEGKVATKLVPRDDDGDEEYSRYDGYIMATSTAAKRWVWRLARRRNAQGDVAIVMPGAAAADRQVLEDTVKEWEMKLNCDRQDDFVSLGLTHHPLVLHDPINDEYITRDTIMIFINDERPLLLLTAEGGRILDLDVAPELNCADDEEEDVLVEIIRPLCKEAGVGEWADNVFKMTERNDVAKEVRKLIGEGTPDPKLNVRVLADRSIKYRGEVLNDARVKAIVTVTPQKADALIMKSGLNGVIYEHAVRERNEEYKKVKLPLEWTISDCNTAINELSPQQRKMVRGVVPSARGFMARTKPGDEADVTRILNPQLAEELGPSLGIHPNSTWLIKNLPKKISKQELINMLAANSGQWSSWFILPKFVTGDRSSKWSSWVVEAEEPPPAKMFKIRGTYATIQRYVNERAMHPSMRIWASPIAQMDVKHRGEHGGRATKVPWSAKTDADLDVDLEGDEEQEHESEDAGTRGAEGQDDRQPNGQQSTYQAEQGTHSAQSVWRTGRSIVARRRDGPYPPVRAAAPTRPRSYMLTDSESTDAGKPPHKKRFGEATRVTQLPWPAEPTGEGLAEQERAALLAQISAKDAQIADLQMSINRMQATLESMMAALAANGLLGNPANATQTPVQLQTPGQQQQSQQPMAQQSSQAGASRPKWHEVTESEEAAAMAAAAAEAEDAKL